MCDHFYGESCERANKYDIQFGQELPKNFSELLQMTNGSFGGNISGIKQDWLTFKTRDICAYQQEGKQ